MIDTQSTSSFIDKRVLTLLNVPADRVDPVSYRLTTLDRFETTVDTERVCGLAVQSLAGDRPIINLPPVYVHPMLPDASKEVATSSMVKSFAHIKHLSDQFPKSVSDFETLVLIGVDCGQAMTTHVHGKFSPWAHETPLGFTLIGPMGHESAELPSSHRVCRSAPIRLLPPAQTKAIDSDSIFQQKADDELPGRSREDSDFLHIVTNGFRLNERGKIEIPLPFKDSPTPPKNAEAVYNRAATTLAKLKKDPEKLAQCTTIIDGYLKKGHVKQLDSGTNEDRTFIPVFPIYNANKKKTRLVFDSSAKYKGVSLNNCLLQGADVTNSLLGVLLRFRHDEVAYSADIEHMYHCFDIPSDQHKFLCFYWWKDNDPKLDLGIFAATVHIFGNTSSPAIATHGLRFDASLDDDPTAEKARNLVYRNFYVDDLLKSDPNFEQAISNLSNARRMLAQAGMRLHKIVSSHSEVIDAFPPEEIARDVTFRDIDEPTQQSALGIRWAIRSDRFQLKCEPKTSAFTRRGILSVIGCIFDPKGIAAPFTLRGKLIQRRILAESHLEGFSWDAELPEEFREIWQQWTHELKSLNELSIPRCFKPPNFGEAVRIELHVFCDASADSIGHVLYLRQLNRHGEVAVAFVVGSSKVAPKGTSSIPRLELCAALNATIATSHVMAELDLDINEVYYYSDSRVVLGYLTNRERRFNRYVTARIDGILGLSTPEQWYYVATDVNPADLATKPQTPSALMRSSWLTGPKFLHQLGEIHPTPGRHHADEFVDLPEKIRQEMSLSVTVSQPNEIFETTFKHGDLKRAIRILTYVLRFIRNAKKENQSNNDLRINAMNFLVREVQRLAFPSEFATLQGKDDTSSKSLSSNSSLQSLCPFWDSETRVIRVGGRLKNSDFDPVEVHPALLPANHPLTQAIIELEHTRTRHQGRTVTAAAIRRAGFHILHCTAVIKKFLAACVLCQKLRGKLLTQQMADLPRKRLEDIAPYENAGVDCFGPFYVSRGRDTRRSTASKKIWVVIFTCLYSRAVHLETLLSMDTPTFLLAFRRFEAKRGKCRYLLSDHGSNFLGASKTQEECRANKDLIDALEGQDLTWEKIPPNAPHFAGVWERKIGPIKSILAASLPRPKDRPLAEDEFTTLLEEAASIVNNTPLAAVPSDPNEPFPPCPAMLLNLRHHSNTSSSDITEDDIKEYGRRRWRRVQALSNCFWNSWKRDYISQLQVRNKWRNPKRNLNIGDVVIVKEQSPRNSWPMAVVERVHHSDDGLVRSATLRLPSNRSGHPRFKDRPIHNLVLLIPNEDSKKL